jgi:hypothetical protein
MSRPVLFFLLAMIAMTHSPSEWPVAGPSGLAAEAVKPIRISVAIRNRSLANPVQKDIRITQGDVLELVFTTDEPAELHLHGYDIYLNVVPGTPAVLRVDAKIAGRYALESHRFGSVATEPRGADDHLVLLHLSIYPR